MKVIIKRFLGSDFKLSKNYNSFGGNTAYGIEFDIEVKSINDAEVKLVFDKADKIIQERVDKDLIKQIQKTDELIGEK